MKLDFNALAQRLLLGSETLVPSGCLAARRRGHEWVCGDLSGGEGTSLSVNLLSGRWADFATSDRGGDLIDLYAAIHELTMAEAYRELDDGSAAAAPARPAKPAKPPRTVVTPVPEAAADCECVHPLYGAPSARWTYWDGNGEVLGYVARYDPPGQRKQIVPWTWDGDRWGMGQWPVPRPLYRIQELEARSADPILIVEGEKAADAAAAISGPYVVTTWPGGGQAVSRANWKPVHGRKVLLWPDADDAGIATMQRLAAMLAERCPEVKIIDPAGMPDGWDAADSGFTSWQDARAWIAPRTSVFAQQPEPEPPKPAGPEPEERAEPGPDTDQAVVENLEPADWYKRFAFLLASADFFDMQRRRLVERKAFDAMYRHHKLFSIHVNGNGGAPRVTASVAYDENRVAMRGRTLAGLIYAPGQGVFVGHEDDVYGNTWKDGRPAGIPGDVAPWLEHAERMIPDQQEREHCLDWMAYKVQHPAAKINHGILHGGRQGSGKDTLWVPFLYAVGGKGGQNVKTVTTEEIQSNFHYHLLSEVCVLNELREPALADRRALENKLKPLLAAPPEVFSINEKGRHPYPALNRLSVLGFSNERVSLSLSADDRRWMVLWSEAGILPQDEAKRLWSWYESGGLDHVAYWLRQRDVSAFAPGERPLMTDAKAVMLEGGLSPGEALLAQAMRDRVGPFRPGAVMGPWQPLVDALQEQQQQHKISIQSLYVAAQHAGWLDLGKIRTKAEHSVKKHILCSPETLEKYGHNRSEIRRMLETLGPTKATVHELRRAE
jgi:hypothetical protein